MLAGEVEAPVFLEVPVADHRAQGQDGFGAVQAPSGPSNVEAVGDEMPACSLDDAGRDGPAVGEGLVVAQVLVPGVQVAHAGVHAGSPAAGQAGGAGLSGDLLRGPVAVAGQYRECPGRDPVLGCGVAGLVQAPRGFPDVTRARG